MASKVSQKHFALILVKEAEEAWGIGLIGQRLPSRNPVHHTRPKMASSTLSSRNHRGTMEDSPPRLKMKNATENLKNVIFCLKKSEKSEHFYVNQEHFLG